MTMQECDSDDNIIKVNHPGDHIIKSVTQLLLSFYVLFYTTSTLKVESDGITICIYTDGNLVAMFTESDDKSTVFVQYLLKRNYTGRGWEVGYHELWRTLRKQMALDVVNQIQ